MELLKQPLGSPLSLWEQVVTLCFANDGIFDKVETKKVKEYQREILDYMSVHYKELCDTIEREKALTEEVQSGLKEAEAQFQTTQTE